MQNVRIIVGKQPDLDDAINMYVQIGWGKREQYDAAKFQKAFDNSKFILAYNEEALVGMVRLMSDEAHETNVSEFLVRPEFQKKGIGKKLLEKLHETYGHTDLYISTPKEHEEFFLKNGMKPQTSLKQVSRRAAA